MISYYQLDKARLAAELRGDEIEAARLARLMERLDDYRTTYGCQHRA